MTIDDVKTFISTATTEDLNQILDAIGARLEQIETPGFTARALRSAIKSARSRTAKVPGKGSDACLIRQGMRAGRSR